MKKLALVSVLALSSLLGATAHAESSLVVGSGSAIADLKFKVVIPRVLFLGVGTGAATLVASSAKDTLSFDYSTNAATIGTGVPAASITNDSSGAFAGSVVPVKVFGNGGQITLTTTNPSDLTNTSGDTIPFSQISAITSVAGLPVPALSGGTSAPVLTTGTKVTNQSANWTFAYANTVTPAAGTYTGTVTYTASMP